MKPNSRDLLNCPINWTNTRANLKYLHQITLVSLVHSFLLDSSEIRPNVQSKLTIPEKNLKAFFTASKLLDLIIIVC